jgi:hypothetical protein
MCIAANRLSDAMGLAELKVRREELAAMLSSKMTEIS